MTHDVFISHSAKNKETGDAVCAALEANGIRCWIAPRDVTAGMEWGECIIDAIKRARVMVLVFTAEANASAQVRREVERAANHGVKILPLRIENVLPDRALEYFIGNVHWLDALKPPLESHLQTLANTVKVLLGETPPTVEGVARELIQSIEYPTHTIEGRRPDSRRRPLVWWRRGTVIVPVAATILAAAGGAYQFYAARKPASAADEQPAVKARHSVAVLGFENLGAKDQEWLGTALSEMLSTELAAGETLRTMSGEDVARMKADLSLADMSTYSKDTLAKIRTRLGPDYVVAGSFLASGPKPSDTIRVNLQLQDTQSGETALSVAQDGTLDSLSKLLDTVGAGLRDKLGVQAPSPEDSTAAKAALPSSPDALRLYSEGLAKLRVLDALGARDQLETAVSLDPSFALAHSALADAWQLLGYDQNAQQEAKKALDLSTPLSQVDRRSIEARYRKMTSDWNDAIEIYSALWGVYDDEPNYALELASVQTSAGKAQDALATLADLRKRPDLNVTARIDLEEAEAADSLSNIKLQQSSAARAADEATRQGARYLAAQAYWQNCQALLALSDLKGAAAACQKGSEAADYAGGQEAKARNISVLATIMETEGQRPAAMELRQEALQIAQQIGSRKDAIGALVNLANLQDEEGNSNDARANYQKAIQLAGEIGDKQQLATLQLDLAADYDTQGDYLHAGPLYQQSLQNAQRVGDKNGIAFALQSLGLLYFQLGDLATAHKDADQAVQIAQTAGLESIQAISLSTLGDIQMAQGDLTGAEKSYSDALALFTQRGDGANVASVRASLARLVLEQGNAAQAEKLARQAVEDLQADKLVDNEADARDALARALLAEGKLPDAQSEIDSAAKIAVQDQGVKMSLAITAAQLQARKGMIAEAQKNLNASLQEATRLKLVGSQLEIELARAQIQETSDPKGASAELQALRNEAAGKGYVLIANKASRQVQLAAK